MKIFNLHKTKYIESVLGVMGLFLTMILIALSFVLTHGLISALPAPSSVLDNSAESTIIEFQIEEARHILGEE